MMDSSRIPPRVGSARRSMPFGEWPEADREAWQEAMKEGDPFEEAGRAAHWRPSTQVRVMKVYGHWLTFLTSIGILQSSVPPADRIGPELVASYIAHLRTSCCDTTALLHVLGLIEALRVMFPDHDRSWLRLCARRLRANMSAGRNKLNRIRPARELFDLGVRLMQDAERGVGTSARWLPVRFRDGLMISLLAARPIRLKNLASIRLGKHIIEAADGYLLCFPAEETKTGQPIEVPVPLDLAPSIERYVERYRAVLLGGTRSDHFWISNNGTPLRPATIYHQITLRTKQAFGTPINPHLFRDCVATSIAIEDPEHVYIATVILGHTTPETTNRHYNHAQMLSAVRAYGSLLRELRR